MSEIRANNLVDESGLGSPSFPNGLRVTGITTFSSVDATDVVVGSAVTINSSGINAGIVTATGLTITNGNVVVSSGYGIDFSATSDGSGTMSSELLDDYEEGTWTPVYTPGSGSFTSVTYELQNGRYTKIGNTVFLDFVLKTDAITVGTASGTVEIGGLPFNISSSSPGNHLVGGRVAWANGFASNNPESAVTSVGSSLLLAYRTAIGGTYANYLQVSSLGTGANANWLSVSFVALVA